MCSSYDAYNESGQSKAAFCQANSLNNHQFLYWWTKFNKKTHPLIPVRITNANEPLAIIRLPNGSTLEVVCKRPKLASRTLTEKAEGL